MVNDEETSVVEAVYAALAARIARGLRRLLHPYLHWTGPEGVAGRVKPADLAAVWLGGTIGTAVRVLLTPPHAATAFPVATFVINLVDAGLLGLLAERLARGPDCPRRHRLSLLGGTGFLGGFTTYSALAVDTVQLLGLGEVGLATAYALATLLLGALATWLGIAAGRARRSRP